MHGRHRRAGGGAEKGWVGWLALPGLLALVAEPLIWLWRSWWDPSYQSDGAIVAGVLAALVLASLRSGTARPDPHARRMAWWLLLGTAAIRLAGRLLAVRTLGALALLLDVAAVGLLLGVARRPFALSPWALAAFAGLALPVEHLAQRLLGHPLQLLATQLSYGVIQPLWPDVVRTGTLLVHPGIEVAVDLPCSGARGLVLLGGALLLVLCRCRPTAVSLVIAVLAALAGASVANALRIVALFAGGLRGWPVHDEPLHGLLGTGALMLGAWPLLALLLRWPRRMPAGVDRVHTAGPIAGTARRRAPAWTVPLAISAAGLIVASAPARPLDVSPRSAPRPLPNHLGAYSGEALALSPLERRYYTRYGGHVGKRAYRSAEGTPFTALRVRTASPLRHLHGPDRCLLGAGHRVTRLGVEAGPIPTVTYRSQAPDGTRWRVEASFVSDEGEWANGVSEVVWRWLERPDVAWSLIERITPWSVCEIDPARCRDFDGALFRALDLPVQTRAGVVHRLPGEALGSDPNPARDTKESIHAARFISLF